jgi:hypothetical protein
MKTMWKAAVWAGLNVAVLLGMLDLVNMPSTLAVIVAIFCGLVLITLNIKLVPRVFKGENDEPRSNRQNDGQAA